MSENIVIEKNKDYIIDIIGMGYEGEGVGKLNNFTIFVQGALIGETVKVKIVKVAKNYAYGKLLDIIKQSFHRREPICSIYKRCGGCQMQHMSYEAQLQFKTERVKEVIARIGKLKDVTVHPVIGMEEPYRYRNKVQLPVGKVNGEVQIGFYAPRSHDIVNMETCYIQDKIADKVISLTKEWIIKYNIETYDENEDDGNIRHIMVRRGFKTKEVMVVIVTRQDKLPYYEEFVDLITKNIQGIKSIIQNVNHKKTNVILGEKNKTLWGSDVITDYIGKFKFNISPLSFFQVNPVQTEVLYNKALEYAGLSGNETVFDAYCGTGTISLFLSQKAKKVYGVEIVPQAIEDAKKNALQNNVDNVEFLTGESEKVIPELIEKGIKAQVVVVDPPRKGCERSLLEAIANMVPERIVYVSCDAATLARDLGILQELNYKTIEVQPVDNFPQTAHVECVVLITKK
ncbi:23S rRNA (uracil(1939)-C(5))-methyltransferase RlmD [Clostridium sp. SYSU_GA19001]|uniref:23S rRNA (uracil(1939)-C(5))-methyltransferase RlmD n=1 Tax=Clostridium caldaquaticum TaxID=2940653 RepID=UPI002077963F|nr:23S rRNA (uracil(1939)-C(5))-methyltransferase RlmD [Clostridium caldaquaticum]MCM8710134.1 23S rRNA (uracil(1939)-C(5))-methyltransferase RlmD [Clostridium caldaquaticum]